MERNSQKPRDPRRLRRWHRWIGLTVALFLVFLAFTGVALNHSQSLRLQDRLVSGSLVTRLFGLPQPHLGPSFVLGEAALTQLGDRLYLNTREIAEINGALLGALRTSRFLVIAVDEQIQLFDFSGALVEILNRADGVPAGMYRIGLSSDEALVVKTDQQDYELNMESLTWQTLLGGPVEWARTGDIPAAMRDAIIEQHRGRGLPMERILLDLHSGRVFGSWGVVLVDGIGLLAIVLALTGIWMWAIQRT